jgi:anti-sigma factor RsiW
MECPLLTQENAELLLAYCARKLDSETERVLERHMEHCDACRKFGESQKLVWTALDAWETSPVSMDFDRRLYRRIESEQQKGWLSRLFSPVMPPSLPPIFRPALPLAAACITLLAVFLINTPTQSDLSRQVRIEKVDVDKVESALEDLDMLQQFSVVATAEEEHVQSL